MSFAGPFRLCMSFLDHSKTATAINKSPLIEVIQKKILPPIVDELKIKPLNTIIIKPVNPQKPITHLDLLLIAL